MMLVVSRNYLRKHKFYPNDLLEIIPAVPSKIHPDVPTEIPQGLPPEFTSAVPELIFF